MVLGAIAALVGIGAAVIAYMTYRLQIEQTKKVTTSGATVTDGTLGTGGGSSTTITKDSGLIVKTVTDVAECPSGTVIGSIFTGLSQIKPAYDGEYFGPTTSFGITQCITWQTALAKIQSRTPQNTPYGNTLMAAKVIYIKVLLTQDVLGNAWVNTEGLMVNT